MCFSNKHQTDHLSLETNDNSNNGTAVISLITESTDGPQCTYTSILPLKSKVFPLNRTTCECFYNINVHAACPVPPKSMMNIVTIMIWWISGPCRIAGTGCASRWCRPS